MRLDEARSILGDEPQKKFRELSKIHHPDVGGDIEEFRRIQDAYDTLLKADMTAEYDLLASLFLQELDIPAVLVRLGKLEADAFELIASLPTKKLKFEAAKPKALGFLSIILDNAIKNLDEEKRTANNSLTEISRARVLLNNLYTN